jgi:hypothetical protein
VSEVYLVDGARTRLDRYGGVPAGVRPDDPAALVVGEAVRRAGAGMRGGCRTLVVEREWA